MDTTSIRTPSKEVGAECFACYRGVVYIGHLIEEDGEEVEVIEAVRCWRCSAADEL